MVRKPEYSAQKWQREWEENQAFLDNISHFPKDWWIEDKSKTVNIYGSLACKMKVLRELKIM